MLIVKKFGGSSVANAERINHVAQTIVNSYKEGNQVVVVLSAQGDTTDELIEKAKEINPNASKREMDMLLSTGEQQSVALMAMAINKLGYPAISLNAFQCNIYSTSTYSNARIKDIATTTGRITQGVRLINLNDGVTVVSMDKISAEDTVEEESEENNTEVTAETTEE